MFKELYSFKRYTLHTAGRRVMDSFRSLSDSDSYVSVEQSCEPNQTVTYCKKTLYTKSIVTYNILVRFIIVDKSEYTLFSLVAEA